MGAESSTRKFIALVGEIEHGKSKKFTLRRGQRDIEALLVNFEGNHFAYQSVSSHRNHPRLGQQSVLQLRYSLPDVRHAWCCLRAAQRRMRLGALFRIVITECSYRD